MRLRIPLLVLGLAAFGAGPLVAQAWDAPSFMPPGPEDNLGIYVVDPDINDFGVFGIWRQSGRVDLGLRAGIFGDDDVVGLVGAEVKQRLQAATRALPVNVDWTLGIGGTFGNGSFVRIPVGVTAGRQFSAGGLGILPYAHPRIGFDISIEDDDDLEAFGEDEDLDISLTLDLGADVAVGRSLLVRFSAAIGDWDAIGIGVALQRGPAPGVAGR